MFPQAPVKGAEMARNPRIGRPIPGRVAARPIAASCRSVTRATDLWGRRCQAPLGPAGPDAVNEVRIIPLRAITAIIAPKMAVTYWNHARDCPAKCTDATAVGRMVPAAGTTKLRDGWASPQFQRGKGTGEVWG
jgi:hypothetical protein